MYNLFNKFLSDISALLLHTCVQLRQPYKLVETTQSFLQCTTLNQTQQGVLLYSIPNATFIDCEFFESSDSTLYASITILFFEGNITFRDNTATYGAGLALIDSSVMYLRPNTHIMFSDNHATYAGGAIYVQSFDTGGGNFRCFYQLDKVNQAISDLNIQITFENNTADFAGSALYGGLIDFCLLVPVNKTRNNSFDSIFKVQNTERTPLQYLLIHTRSVLVMIVNHNVVTKNPCTRIQEHCYSINICRWIKHECMTKKIVIMVCK